MSEFLNKYTAIYRCLDDISNLKIKIKIREVENFGSESSNQWNEAIFKWQEKKFSQNEIEFYRDEKNCITDLEKKYHLDVKTLTDSNQFHLFSYINEDDFVPKDDLIIENDDADEYDYRKSLISAVQNPISYNYDFESMYLMADFGEYVDTSWIKYEKTLCIIKFDKKHRVLSIYPDFTRQPYFLPLDGSTRKFEYLIENASDKLSDEENLKEMELIRKLNSVKKIDLTFVLPPRNKLQIYLFCEILYAKQFEYDTIYVQYFIDLPPEWISSDPNQLQGITQTCHAHGDEKLSHFGHVFDVLLEYNLENFEKTKIPKSPYIYFEVISKDTWSRFRTEGLTYTSLQVARSGCYRFELQCFRLIPDTISGQLRRFFIGDCSNYNDLRWIGLPKGYEGSFLNKYGTNTVGTGQIGIRMNVVQQSQAFLEHQNEKIDDKLEIFEKLNSSSLVKSVEQVLQAFKRARKNMIAARKNL